MYKIAKEKMMNILVSPAEGFELFLGHVSECEVSICVRHGLSSAPVRAETHQLCLLTFMANIIKTVASLC